MPAAKKVFEDFINWLYSDEVQAPSTVRRFANLVLDNFDAVAKTNRQRSARSALLADLARKQLANSIETPAISNSVANPESWPWQQLHSLTLGPFRGFRYSESFDLQKKILLFYGPNGSGKTSLCEALEFSLLGAVSEAEAKRITDNIYLTNIHENSFLPPILKAVDHQNKLIDVIANADLHRFCFIEKNRIDSFSRLAARPPAQRSDLIATLFGLDNFSDFVSDFNDSMDNQLVTTNKYRTLLAGKREAIAQDQIEIDQKTQNLASLTSAELALATSFQRDLTYEGLKRLIGSEKEPGRLKQLNDLLDAVTPPLFNITSAVLLDEYQTLESLSVKLTQLESDLQTKSELVSFKALYDAVLALQASIGDRCPACDTPLTGAASVSKNPYSKATTGLNELKDLSIIQENKRDAQSALTHAENSLRSSLHVIENFLKYHNETDSLIAHFIQKLTRSLQDNWWSALAPSQSHVDSSRPTFDDILKVALRIEEQDQNTKQLLEQRNCYISERDTLLKLQLQMQQQDDSRASLTQKLEIASKRIASFDEEHAELIRAATEESVEFTRDAPIKEAYDDFITHIKRYLNLLPAQLIAGLNNLAKDLYNDFNRDDLPSDKLATLQLPLTADKKIQISFCGNPELCIDALHVLSEGHIRCLGLAILLAKNIQLNCPLIIFDDAINAIDHEHRRGIRETIFASDRFTNTQIIVTCHSNEFIKDIHQSLPTQYQNESLLYVLKTHTGNYQPRIVGNLSNRNYIARARASRNLLDERAALDASRKALELQTERIWRWLAKHEHGAISIVLSYIGAEPALRNLCESLKKKLSSLTNFSHPDKDLVISALDRLLGVPPQNRAWQYLNKGTHEEANRDDFEGHEVENIVKALEELNALTLR